MKYISSIYIVCNSSSPSTDQTPWNFSAENFDIHDDPFFWEELKAGLVRKIIAKVPGFSPGLKSNHSDVIFSYN